MYILVLLSRIFNRERESLIYLKQVQLARLAELLFIAFEIHGCILEPSTAQNDEEKLEIEDGNRLSVIAGDFLMAAASSQLAEIENQTVVAQISKSIADISSGTLYDLSVLGSEEEWLHAKSQRDLSLVKRAAWSTIILQEEQFNEEKLIGKDVADHCGKFAADLMLLKCINDDISKYTSGQTEARNLLPTLYQANGLSSAKILSEEVYDRCTSSLEVLPDCNEKKIFEDYTNMLRLPK
ncbi:Oidioi.mRNA.OKI2018_I69.XSR.g15841.t1.cds [Oikopleura dioica]|uniref:Oidioi.mRNA.OKI2018_I69.XSR.g15841.t1.cds n=1 Tax=Oikopleura dioica TaxID=34765 RepID=A0ABN7SI50_OIKDI|nr:Oidioi.mRNA.OKI2018_I69.XSR.g15841.t1.cds [Oikopleura dioica]